jgi:hypothetical protein
MPDTITLAPRKQAGSAAATAEPVKETAIT